MQAEKSGRERRDAEGKSCSRRGPRLDQVAGPKVAESSFALEALMPPRYPSSSLPSRLAHYRARDIEALDSGGESSISNAW